MNTQKQEVAARSSSYRDSLYLLSKERLITMIACERMMKVLVEMRRDRMGHGLKMIKRHGGRETVVNREVEEYKEDKLKLAKLKLQIKGLQSMC